MHYTNFPGHINVEKNSVFNHYYPQKTKKAAGEDRDLSAGLDDKQVDGGNEWRGLYNGRKPP